MLRRRRRTSSSRGRAVRIVVFFVSAVVVPVAFAPACTLVYSADRYDSAEPDAGNAVATDALADTADRGDGNGKPCAFTVPVHHLRNPATQAHVFAVGDEVTTLTQKSYEDLGVAFTVATTDTGPLAAVHRLYQASTDDRLYALSASELQSATAAGYADEGIAFYGYGIPASCLVAVHGLSRGPFHTLTSSTAEVAALRADGWSGDNIRFYAGAP